jgi:hypothetical protein
MTDLSITGSQSDSASFTPLITYVPLMRAQQSIDIPFTFTYSGTNGASQQGAIKNIKSCMGPDAELIAGFIDGLNAFANAFAQCPKDRAAIAVCGVVAVSWYVAFSKATTATKPLKAAKLVGCIIGTLLSAGTPPVNPTSPTTPAPQGVQQFVPIDAGCFAAETRVLLADGTSQTIDRLKAGEVVKSGPGPREVATVAAAYRRRQDGWRELEFGLPGQAQPVLMRTTQEHLFWEDGNGWVPAARLNVGDWLLNEHGQAMKITANRPLAGPHDAFTLKLLGGTAFYANGVLVHDLCGGVAQPEPARPDSGAEKPAANLNSSK